MKTRQPPASQLEYYTQPANMTTAGRYASLFDELPRDVAELARIAQGVVIHEFMAAAYGFTVPEARRAESHIRAVEQMLEKILALDAAPLTTPRPTEKRLMGVCHHFALLLVAMLRAGGIPARARCGFGTYFNPGYAEDHWVCEYWDSAQGGWKIADPQFDELWCEKLRIEHDALDVPRDRFLVAGEAWTRCRTGAADPTTFGIFRGNLRGLWFIAGDLVRDVAALNNQEMLPWDVWGAMPGPDEQFSPAQLEFFDDLAAATRRVDVSHEDVQARYETDDRLRVPGTVFNALRQRPETI